MSESSSGPIKAPQDFASGLFLVALALFAWWMASNLNPGTLRAMGPGMVPRGVAFLIGVVGVALIVGSFVWHGPKLERAVIRGPLFITLGIISFGLTVRGFPIRLPGGLSFTTPALGMLGGGPLAILIAGLASEETKWIEIVVFAVAMTGFCWLLFKVALNLPIPLAPFLIGY